MAEVLLLLLLLLVAAAVVVLLLQSLAWLMLRRALLESLRRRKCGRCLRVRACCRAEMVKVKVNAVLGVICFLQGRVSTRPPYPRRENIAPPYITIPSSRGWTQHVLQRPIPLGSRVSRPRLEAPLRTSAGARTRTVRRLWAFPLPNWPRNASP
jgi:hypothetical protein